jgi:predicted MFS family arabinose efflux permease
VAGDLVTSDNRERAYASTRVMFNLGSVLGPPLAGLLLLGGNWSVLFLVFGLLGLTTVVIVLLLPLAAVDKASGDAPSPGRGRVLADRAFLLLLASTFVGYFSYVSFSSVLPVAAVTDYQLPESLWGFIFAINPIAVVLLQLRTTQATRTIGSGPKLIGSSLLMGLPFLVLLVLPNAVGIVLVTCVFVAGEMVWVPVIQGMVVTMAPPKQRGRYLGAYRSVGQVAMGLAPFVLLNLRGLGPHWAWVLVAAICVLGAALGTLAVRMSCAGSHEP